MQIKLVVVVVVVVSPLAHGLGSLLLPLALELGLAVISLVLECGLVNYLFFLGFWFLISGTQLCWNVKYLLCS